MSEPEKNDPRVDVSLYPREMKAVIDSAAANVAEIASHLGSTRDQGESPEAYEERSERRLAALSSAMDRLYAFASIYETRAVEVVKKRLEKEEFKEVMKRTT